YDSLHCYYSRSHLHAFPTRRSSDLARLRLQHPQSVQRERARAALHAALLAQLDQHLLLRELLFLQLNAPVDGRALLLRPCIEQRSEEHTSELQSREKLVCRLLLEKK